MLTADYLDILSNPISSLYEEFHLAIIRDIARRLVALNFASAGWQAQRLIEAGKLYGEILFELSKITGESEDTIAKILHQAGVRSLSFDSAVFKAAGFDPVELRQSATITRLLVEGIQRTNGVMRNLTATTALTGQEAYIRAADLAYWQVATGAKDYNSAIREAVKNVAAEGIEVINFTGSTDKIDVAVRRTVLTGVTQTTSEMQLKLLNELGADEIQVSAHIGARNTGEGYANHESWQGKVYSVRGNKYPNFFESTGYGTGEGLSGWNCRHSFYPFFPGISKEAYNKATLDEYADKKVNYNGKEIDFYKATQTQRRYEREIRKAKRELAAVEAAGLDVTAEIANLAKWRASMRDFIQQTGLIRRGARERI